MRLTLRGITCALVLMTCGPAAAATLPAGFSETLVAGGLRKPTAMAIAPDGRLFICEQEGRLRVVSDGVLRPTPFVSLPVNFSGERGLLGVAFDPAFETNHFVYVYYTATTPNIHNRVSRFTANGDVAVPGSEQVILDLNPLSGRTNHNGGAIHFGADGKLYVAVGENANGDNAQSLSTRLGKILRINSDGTIPADNPFFDVAVGANRAIWALGVRNPFTFSFQPGTGIMFINDVGQDTWEEINLGVAGANYGWPDTEGPTNDPRFRSPIYAYGHSDGCAITGGAFYNPATVQFPFAYRGAYFFADNCGGWIRRRNPDTSIAEFATGIPSPVDLQVGAEGSLYYLARGGSANAGVVVRVDYLGPRLTITANGQHGLVVLGPQDPLAVSMVFTKGNGPTINPGEVYVGATTVFGTLWLDPASGRFVPTPTRLYSGPVDSFGPSAPVNLPDASVLPSGPYWFFAIVDNDADGVPDGTHFDTVLTVVP